MKNRYKISIILTILGIGFIIWGTIIYLNYPLMPVVREIQWKALKTSAVQNIVGYVLLISSFLILKIKNNGR